MTDKEHQIRERAYSIWEAEGYPHGRAEDHWHRAAREVAETDAAPAEHAATNGDAAGAEMNGASAEPADAEPVAAAAKPVRRRKTAAAMDGAPKKRAVQKT